MPPTNSTEQPVDVAAPVPAATRAPRRRRRDSAPTTAATDGKKDGKTSRTSRTAKGAAPAPPTEPNPPTHPATPPTPPAPPAPPTQPAPPPSDGVDEVVEPAGGTAVAYVGAVRRQAASAASRRARQRPGPVARGNVLDELPDALRRLALRTGDVRKVRKIRTPSGAPAIEMDMATARSLSLVP